MSHKNNHDNGENMCCCNHDKCNHDHHSKNKFCIQVDDTKECCEETIFKKILTFLIKLGLAFLIEIFITKCLNKLECNF